MASSIDRKLPADNSPLVSLEMRNQFGAAADDHETLETSKLDATHATDPSAHGGAEGHVADTNNPHGVTAAQAGADPAGEADAKVGAHESAFDHNNLPTADQKAALDNAPTAPNAGNPYATVADVPPSAGEANTISARGSGYDLTRTKNLADLGIAALVSGDNSVSFATVGEAVDVRATLPAGAGTLRIWRKNSGANVSDGRARTNVVEGNLVTVNLTDDSGAGEAVLEIGTTAEINTTSTPATVGANEAAVTMAKSASDLPFRKLAGTAYISLVQGTEVITIDLTAGTIAILPSSDQKAAMDAAAAPAAGNAFATLADLVTVLRSDAGRVVNSDVGYPTTIKTVDTATLGGTYSPNPLDTTAVTLTGTTATTINTAACPQGRCSSMRFNVPDGLDITLSGWVAKTSRSGTAAAILHLDQTDNVYEAFWT